MNFELLVTSVRQAGRIRRGEMEPARQLTRRAGMELIEVLKEKREEILRIATRHGASNVRVFGSVARGEADAQSDVDLLVELEKGRSLLDHAALMLDLEKLLGRRVNVATERGLKPQIREHILREALRL